MRTYNILINLLILMYSCQSDYWVGSSSVSIEPTSETVSLALAGYAAPYEGRFTLGWEEKGTLVPVTYLTGLGNRIYGINLQKDIVSFDAGHLQDITIKKTNLPVELIAGHGNRLFGIGEGGEIYVALPTSEIIQWEKTPSCIEGVNAFTSSGKNLYVATNNGELLEGTIGIDLEVSWRKVASIGICRSLASDGKRLYALGEDSVLYQCELCSPQESWVRIGYKNNVTYLIDIFQIAYLSGNLCALTLDNVLYSNVHNSEGNLTSRALSIKKGGKIVVIVCVDVCGFDYSFVSDIKKEIYLRKGIPPEEIFINASHSHFTPVTQSWFTWEKQNQYPDSLYLNHVVRPAIIRSIEESINDACKSDLFFARNTTNIGKNRRFTGKDGVYDDVVDVVKVIPRNNEKGNSILFMTGCHPVFDDTGINKYMLSANFPGHARSIIEEYKGVENSLFLQGCAGDINPKDPFRITGEQLANNVLDVLETPMTHLSGDISCYMDTINISVTPWDTVRIQDFLDQAKLNPEDGVARRNVRWAEWMLDNNEMGMNSQLMMPVYVQTINIGDWKLIGLSREVTSEFALAIRNLWPDHNVSVVAYTNDVSSYLATDPHILAKDYEGYDSFFWYGQPTHFPLKTFETVINHIKENSR